MHVKTTTALTQPGAASAVTPRTPMITSTAPVEAAQATRRALPARI